MIGYYYCTLSTFLNILKSKQIYLSDPLKMNDYLEIKWYLNLLNNEKITEDMTMFEMLRQRSYMDFTLEELLENLRVKGQSSIYIGCFSKEPDLLSQWRGYAEDGKGVSIGFELDNLKIADNFMIEEIKYTDKVVQNGLETDVEIVADTISTVFHEGNITAKEEQIEVLLHELIPVLAKYKNPAFGEEKEVRLIYCDDMKFEKIVDSYHAFAEKWTSKELDHDFRIVKNDITEFVKMPFDPGTIKKIYLGPQCLLHEHDVKNIVKKLANIEIEVIKSKASYR